MVFRHELHGKPMVARLISLIKIFPGDALKQIRAIRVIGARKHRVLSELRGEML